MTAQAKFKPDKELIAYKALSKQGNYKTVWQRFQAPFGKSEFVQILTTFFVCQ